MSSAWPGNDERRARLVDQDRIHFVDDAVVEGPLHLLRRVVHHVVAQVVEAELVVRAIRDVGRVGLLLRVVIHLREVHADGHPEEAIDLAHPVGVALREIVVHRHDVHAETGQGIEVGGQRGDERLAFAGPHFRDLAVVKRDAPDQLDIEVAHVEHAFARFAHDGEDFRQDLFECFTAHAVGCRLLGFGGGSLIVGLFDVGGGRFRHPLLNAFAKLVGLRAQRLIGKLSDGRLERVDLTDRAPVLLEQPLVAAAEDLPENSLNHGLGPGPG